MPVKRKLLPHSQLKASSVRERRPPKRHRIGYGDEPLPHGAWDDRDRMGGIYRDQGSLCRGEQTPVGGAVNGVPKGDPTFRCLSHPATHTNGVIVAGWRPITQLRGHYRQPQTLFFERAIAHAPLPHVVRTSRFTPDQIDGVVGDPHLVRFVVPHPELGRADPVFHVYSPYGIQMFFTWVA